MPKSNQWPFCELLIESRVLFLAVYDGSNNLKIRFEGPKMVKDGTTYYLVKDQVGSIRAVVDTLGMTVKEITYDSFGNIIAETNPTFTIPLGFAGGLHDRDTGLVRFGYRDYDPQTGRWTAKDPICFNGGDTNLYGYVRNSPIEYSDPLGLKFEYKTRELEGLIEGTVFPYLNRDPGMGKIITRLKNSPYTYRVRITTDLGGNGFGDWGVNGEGGNIAWNPWAWVNTDGGIISPWLTLGHELGHAYHYDNDRNEYNEMTKPRNLPGGFPHCEDYRNVREVENPAARSLGEGVRRNYDGATPFYPTGLFF